MEPVVEVRRGLVSLALRRGWALLLAGLVLGLLLGAGASRLAPAQYVSEATVFLNPLTGSPYNPEAGSARTDQLAALQTEASILASPVVAEVAAAELGAPLQDGALDRVSVRVPTNSQVLVVSYSGTDADTAARTAQAFAEGYLSYRTERAATATEEQLTRLQAQLDSAQEAFDGVVAQLAEVAEQSTERTLLEQQSQVYSNQIAQIQGQVAEARSDVPNPGSVITPAAVPTEPQGISLAVLVLAGGLLGLVGGAALALLVVVRDDRLHAARAGDVPGIGHVVSVVVGDDADADVRNVDLAVPGAAGYQSTLATVCAQLPPQGGAIAVVGADAETRPAVVAAGLAMAASRADMDVLLVTLDDDVRPLAGWPVPASVLGSGPQPTQDDDYTLVGRRLRVLGGGQHDAIADVLASGTGHQLLQAAGKRFRLVVLACGPVTEAAAQHASSQAGCTLVVARDQRTTHGQLAHAAEILEQLAANPIGYLVTTADAARQGSRTGALARRLRPSRTRRAPVSSAVPASAGVARQDPDTGPRTRAEAHDELAATHREAAARHAAADRSEPDRAVLQYGTGHSGAGRPAPSSPARPLTAAQRDRQ